MTRDERVWTHGTVVPGHGVASGRCDDPRFPDGTIAPQLRFFRERIADFDAYLGGNPYPGTINLAFAGARVEAGAPDFAIGPVRWSDSVPPERFLISRCTIAHGGSCHAAFLYIPDPQTKPDHHQPANIVEILAGPVPGLAYGDAVGLLHSPAVLAIVTR